MASINGIGTGYLGWRHGEDAVSTATLWFTLVYLPVIPLRRHRLRNLTDFDAERIRTLPQAVGALATIGSGFTSWAEHVEVLERTALDAREIAETYARCYLLVPLLCLWPFVLGRFALAQLADPRVIPPPVIIGAITLCMTNLIVVLLVAVRRMRRGPA